MNDCIERKKAIELIQPHVKPQTVYGEGYLQAIEHATDILELIPAADVQPVKQGRWLYGGDSGYYCSYARCSLCDGRGDFKDLFCKHCGARMDGDT